MLFFKRKKEKKESRHKSGGFKRSQVFLKKYYPTITMESELSWLKKAVELKM
jgi:hypothetical protein